jgi:hypothetical protein
MRTTLHLVLPVAVTALCAPASADPGGDWIVLFPDESWNDYPEEQLETFRGVVAYEAEDPLPSYVQRHNPWKLETEEGTFDVYMGSSNEFSGLAGREIEIRGCLETICVEGHVFVEIWPARYRIVSAGPSGLSGPVRLCLVSPGPSSLRLS